MTVEDVEDPDPDGQVEVDGEQGAAAASAAATWETTETATGKDRESHTDEGQAGVQHKLVSVAKLRAAMTEPGTESISANTIAAFETQLEARQTAADRENDPEQRATSRYDQQAHSCRADHC